MIKLSSNSQSKVNSLIAIVNERIANGIWRVGDNLPSINAMSREAEVSRDTVFKAYSELKQRGVIGSTTTKGYFVRERRENILLLLDYYTPYKEQLFRSFTENLDTERYKVEVLFHQYKESLFKTILKESAGRYSHYLVMNFSNDTFSRELRSIPADRLLLLDFGHFDKTGYSYICQDFNQAFYDCLAEAGDRLAAYGKICLLFPPDTMHPLSACDSFRAFCRDRNLDHLVARHRIREEEVRRGTAYICLQQQDLVTVVRSCNRNSFQVGKDIGILMYNDMPVLEIIKKGISAISIDFEEMGRKAAEFVRSDQVIQEFLPTRLVLRNSL